MKQSSAVITILAAAILLTAVHSPCVAEERFGPWVYYAPYYFPPMLTNLGFGLLQDSAMRYESPNPDQPSNAVPPRCGPPTPPPGPAKVGKRIARAGSPMSGSEFRGRSPMSAPSRAMDPVERTSPALQFGSPSRSSENSSVRHIAPRPVETRPQPMERSIQNYDSGEIPSSQENTVQQRFAPQSRLMESPVVPHDSVQSMPVGSPERIEESYESPPFPSDQRAVAPPPANPHMGNMGGHSVAAGPSPQQVVIANQPPKRSWNWGQQNRQAVERPQLVTPMP